MPKTEPQYTIQRSVKISAKTHEKLLAIALRDGVKYGTLLRRIVEDYTDGRR